ncbi:MAG: 50S ribosomal protein L13 [Patescibacteria group bacterium]|nr:50S ribosomal protein L13 [Patescibacteria group bacterium]
MERKLYIIDAEGKAIGRLATQIATILRGKNKVTYRPHLDEGDCVQVVNADKVKITGKKLQQKKYYRVSQYPGGLKETSLEELMAKKPGEALKKAVKQMLPNTKLRPGMLKRLIIK